MGLRLSSSQQLAEGLRGGGHHLTDLHVTDFLPLYCRKLNLASQLKRLYLLEQGKNIFSLPGRSLLRSTVGMTHVFEMDL